MILIIPFLLSAMKDIHSSIVFFTYNLVMNLDGIGAQEFSFQTQLTDSYLQYDDRAVVQYRPCKSTNHECCIYKFDRASNR